MVREATGPTKKQQVPWWKLPTGSIDAGEEIEECAIRYVAIL